MADLFFAVVLILSVEGQERFLPVSYTNTLEECKIRADRIASLSQLHKSNIVGAGCKEIELTLNTLQS